jgi:hypothetical protein
MKTVKLSTLKNMAYVIAKAMIKAHGAYHCVIGGEKVKVVK